VRNQGLIIDIGVGTNQSAAKDLLPAAERRNVAIIAVGVFNSGALANPVDGATYDYAPASLEIRARAQRIRRTLDDFILSMTQVARSRSDCCGF
jgi:D-threo-aldose 1-dehydrogenase